MRELMAHSVCVWESDPEAFHYHPVGYMQIAPEVMHADVAKIYEEQRAIGYPSELIEGEERLPRCTCRACSTTGRRRNITAVLHEKKGGYANNMPSMRGLAGKAEAAGVRIVSPRPGRPGLRVGRRRGHRGVETDQGDIALRAGGRRRRPVGPRLLGHAGPARRPCR